MSGKKVAIIVVAGLLMAGIGGVVGYMAAGWQDAGSVTQPAPSQPAPDPQQPEPNQPEPAPTTPQEEEKPPEQTPPPAPADDVISVRAFHGSGSLPLTDRGLKNSAFDIERLDWSEANNTLVVVAKMRVFEAVAYMRVRDENKEIVEPERIIRAGEGAPAWSPIEGTIPMLPEYKGKTLLIEFYEKSPNDGSRIHMLTFKIKPE